MSDTQARTITIMVTGHPQPKGRGRAVNTPNGPRIHTPKSTAKFEQDVRQEARQVMDGHPPLTGPVKVHFLAVFAPASSWPQWRQKAAHLGVLKNTQKPDVDNLVKIAQDAVNGIVFTDDAQIFEMSVRKEYGDQPRIELSVEEVEQPSTKDEFVKYYEDLM